MRKITKRGFTLVELMIVVAIIGVLAALAIFGVRKYLSNAKTSEAKNTIGAINRAAQAAYNRETTQAEIIKPGESGANTSHALCASATATVPDAVAKVENKKYQPKPEDKADFNTGDATTSWKCLKFTMTDPVYYVYGYKTGAAGLATGETLTNASWTADAMGDLDGDKTTSKFITGGAITNGEAIRATEIKEIDPEE